VRLEYAVIAAQTQGLRLRARTENDANACPFSRRNVEYHLVVDSRSLRCFAWSKADPLGAEFAEVRVSGDVLAARGVAIGSAPFPYRLDYELETASAFVTSRLLVTARGNGWIRSLDLQRVSSGVWEETWTENGANSLPRRAPTDLRTLTGALDVDLGLSPLLNTPPVLRHGLFQREASIEFVMAWVSVPDLAVHRSPQRYTFLRMIDHERSLVRFESLAEDGFKADITYDAEGFVLDYPGIGARI
jgi:hypothetical protein